MGDEDPSFLFARISRLETTMRAVGIEKSESEVIQIILRQLPEHCDVVKTRTLTDSQLTRSRLETLSVPPTPNARPTKSRNEGRRRVRRRPPRTRMLLSSAVVLGTGGRGRRKPTKGRRYGTSRRWHAAAAAAATLVSRRWHAAAAAAAAAMVSRRWYSSSASTQLPCFPSGPAGATAATAAAAVSGKLYDRSWRDLRLREQRRIFPGGLTSPARRNDVCGVPLWPLRQTWPQVRTLCCTASV